jgi:hypothetical protein
LRFKSEAPVELDDELESLLSGVEKHKAAQQLSAIPDISVQGLVTLLIGIHFSKLR